jgi:Concanavalin A-like lectin/glucanases superfamily
LGPILGAPFSPAADSWHHLAYTFDTGGKQQALYIDGIQIAAGPVSKSIGYDAQPLLLGRDTENGIPQFFMAGKIDEATIYNRSLNAAEIMAIYNAGAAGKQT